VAAVQVTDAAWRAGGAMLARVHGAVLARVHGAVLARVHGAVLARVHGGAPRRRHLHVAQPVPRPPLDLLH
jgi:hypothetical protein